MEQAVTPGLTISFAKAVFASNAQEEVRMTVPDYEDTVNVLADHLTMYHSRIGTE